jgi:hypothetical protein
MTSLVALVLDDVHVLHNQGCQDISGNDSFGSMASSDVAGRPLADFEHALLGVIAAEPRSGYGLKKMFNFQDVRRSAQYEDTGAIGIGLRQVTWGSAVRCLAVPGNGGGRQHRGRECDRCAGENRQSDEDAGEEVHIDHLRSPVMVMCTAGLVRRWCAPGTAPAAGMVR